MKKELSFSGSFKELSTDEATSLTGGGIIDTVRCISGTITRSFSSAARTVLLGGTIWGLCRTAGIIDQCAH